MGRTKPKVAKEYVVGLTDGEGCFYVNMGKYPAYRAGTRVQMHFHLKMQAQNRVLLEKVKNTLGCGGGVLSERAESQPRPMLSLHR